MNFRFFDDLVGSTPGSAPGASLEFRFREWKHSAKNYSAKTSEKYLENLHKIVNIFKIFQNVLVKFKKN